jgi:hypothetical protein
LFPVLFPLLWKMKTLTYWLSDSRQPLVTTWPGVEVLYFITPTTTTPKTTSIHMHIFRKKSIIQSARHISVKQNKKSIE